MTRSKAKHKQEHAEASLPEAAHPAVPEPHHRHQPTGEWLIAAIAAAAGVGFSEPGLARHAAAFSASHTCFTWALIVLLVAATVWYLYLFFQRMHQGDDMLRVIFHSDMQWVEHVPYFCAFLAVLGAIVTITGYFLVLLR